MKKLCQIAVILSFTPITFAQTANEVQGTRAGQDITTGDYNVIYGLQEHKQLSYSDAVKELGFCIMHALQCEGKLD